jgi:hypothetical protein
MQRCGQTDEPAPDHHRARPDGRGRGSHGHGIPRGPLASPRTRATTPAARSRRSDTHPRAPNWQLFPTLRKTRSSRLQRFRDESSSSTSGAFAAQPPRATRGSPRLFRLEASLFPDDVPGPVTRYGARARPRGGVRDPVPGRLLAISSDPCPVHRRARRAGRPRVPWPPRVLLRRVLLAAAARVAARGACGALLRGGERGR